MYKILNKQQFSEKVYCIEVEAPLIARSCKPGNFIIIRVDERSERVPYTIAKHDAERGTLTLVVQEVGLSSTKLCRLNPGDSVMYDSGRGHGLAALDGEPCVLLAIVLRPREEEGPSEYHVAQQFQQGRRTTREII